MLLLGTCVFQPYCGGKGLSPERAAIGVWCSVAQRANSKRLIIWRLWEKKRVDLIWFSCSYAYQLHYKRKFGQRSHPSTDPRRLSCLWGKIRQWSEHCSDSVSVAQQWMWMCSWNMKQSEYNSVWNGDGGTDKSGGAFFFFLQAYCTDVYCIM